MERKPVVTPVTKPVLLLILLALFLFPAGCTRHPSEMETANQTVAPQKETSLPGPEMSEETKTVDPVTVEKYFNYFNSNRHLSPIFTFNSEVDAESLDDNLMFFAIQNLPNYSYEEGNTKEEIDALLMKHFGRTVNSYVTSFSEFIPGTERIRATGWDSSGSNFLVLTELREEEDGSLTGHFDVYHVPELYFLDYPGDYEHFKQSILSGNPGQYADLLTYKAIINFNEVPEPAGGFYLKYNSIEAISLVENPPDDYPSVVNPLSDR